MVALRHPPPGGLHDLMAGSHGQVALYAAVVALAVVAVSRKRASASVKLTELALAAAAAFCAFWPGFHHAKAGPRILVFAVLAVVVLVLRSMFRHAVKGKAPAAAARPSGFYAAAQTSGRGRGRRR
jgi:hypothetical protein